MTEPTHQELAEQFLSRGGAEKSEGVLGAAAVTVAQAQVHATLALAEAIQQNGLTSAPEVRVSRWTPTAHDIETFRKMNARTCSVPACGCSGEVHS